MTTLTGETADNDLQFMSEALRIATVEGSHPAQSPIGCIIVLDGKIVAAQRNHVSQKNDATAHAEIEAIRAAGRPFENGSLRRGVLYTTLQPCGMCTMAAIWSKIGRIVYGAGREDVHKMYFEARHVDTLDFVTKAYRDDLTILGGVLREECANLYWRPWDKVPEHQQGNL
jgi:tRNA(adenine34) deaminase